MRQPRGMRGPKDPKFNTCTEHAEVDAAGISVKVGAPYLGRSDSTPTQKMAATRVERRG